MENIHEIYGIIAACFCVAYVPYLYSTLKGHTKPHIFSWFLWALTTGIAFAIQFAEGAGPGAWATGMSTIFCISITLSALKYGHKQITKSDVIFFIMGLIAIVIWFVFKQPLISAFIVAFVDVIGYFPTIRKSWGLPKEEYALSYLINAIKHFFAIQAIIVFNYTTGIYPVSMLIINFIVFFLIIKRRYLLRNT